MICLINKTTNERIWSQGDILLQTPPDKGFLIKLHTWYLWPGCFIPPMLEGAADTRRTTLRTPPVVPPKLDLRDHLECTYELPASSACVLIVGVDYLHKAWSEMRLLCPERKMNRRKNAHGIQSRPGLFLFFECTDRFMHLFLWLPHGLLWCKVCA